MKSLLLLRKITKVFYKYRGLARIAELIRKKYSSSHLKYIIDDFDDNLKFICYLNEHMSSQIFWKGSYSTSQLRFLNKVLKSDMVFIDIGANHGEFTLFVAKRVPKGKVIAFEPVSKLYKKLQENIAINNLQNIETYQIGIGSKKEKLKIYTQAEKFIDGSINDGLPTLHPHLKRNMFLEEIEVDTLDNVIGDKVDRVDMIKIDIEGNELFALQGMTRILQKYRPTLLIEINKEMFENAGYKVMDVFSFLSSYSYTFYRISDDGSINRLVNFNNIIFDNIVCKYEES